MPIASKLRHKDGQSVTVLRRPSGVDFGAESVDDAVGVLFITAASDLTTEDARPRRDGQAPPRYGISCS